MTCTKTRKVYENRITVDVLFKRARTVEGNKGKEAMERHDNPRLKGHGT